MYNIYETYFAKKNAGSKIISIGVAFCLWFVFIYQAGVVNKEYEVPIAFRYVPQDLIVAGSMPSSIKIVVTGNNTDIESFDTKDLSVLVDVKDAKVGKVNINISENNIKLPPYLDLTSISPETIKVSFEEGK